MTAIIATLNKHGVAIASDSAETISNGIIGKVYNTANKLFALSKIHPLGIMICGNAEFMGIPWDIIIKGYRKQLNVIKPYVCVLKGVLKPYVCIVKAKHRA